MVPHMTCNNHVSSHRKSFLHSRQAISTLGPHFMISSYNSFERLMRKIFALPLRKLKDPRKITFDRCTQNERDSSYFAPISPHASQSYYFTSHLFPPMRKRQRCLMISTLCRRKEKKAAHRFIGTQMLCLRLKESIEAASFCPVGRTHSVPLQRL